MADKSGGIGIVGVIIGAVIVIAVAFFFFRGDAGDTGGDVNIETPAPSAPAPAPADPATPPAAPATP
jgi:hypothetical protein